jgi:hypothetical protein
LEERSTEAQLLKVLIDSRLIAEVNDAAKAKWSRLVALDKKHYIVEKRHQEYQAKRLKYDDEMTELRDGSFVNIRNRELN